MYECYGLESLTFGKWKCLQYLPIAQLFNNSNLTTGYLAIYVKQDQRTPTIY